MVTRCLYWEAEAICLGTLLGQFSVELSDTASLLRMVSLSKSMFPSFLGVDVALHSVSSRQIRPPVIYKDCLFFLAPMSLELPMQVFTFSKLCPSQIIFCLLRKSAQFLARRYSTSWRLHLFLSQDVCRRPLYPHVWNLWLVVNFALEHWQFFPLLSALEHWVEHWIYHQRAGWLHQR